MSFYGVVMMAGGFPAAQRGRGAHNVIRVLQEVLW